MKTPPQNHRWVDTLDGSRTLFSEKFQEACHSTNGAYEETILHYIKGCRIEEKIQTRDLNILEVGFGLGIGFLTTLETIKDAPHDFHFLSLEIDQDLVEWAIEGLRAQNLVEPMTSTKVDNYQVVKAKFSKGDMTILVGDARESLPAFLQKQKISFDVIYQDAFSPRKNPTLWTVEWFEVLKNNSHQDVRLSTYSASSSIRKSMIEAGWKLHPGEKFGKKRTSTRATLLGDSDPEILLHLERSSTPALTDKNIETK